MENNRRYTDIISQELEEETRLTMDSRGLAKRAASEGTPIGQLKLRESDTGEAEDRLLEGARQELARIANFIIVEQPDQSDAEESQQVVVDSDKRELTAEQAERTLGALQRRFQANIHLHEGIEWTKVKTALEANPEALWSIAQMESAGHSPDIYHDDKNDYYFGTCSIESPESARNCVYDKEAADWLRENHPDVPFQGSAVEMAEAMGIDLMDPDHYKDILQEKGKFDEKTRSWLLTHSGIRSTGDALDGSRRGGYVYVSRYRARDLYHRWAWRGALRVKKVAA